MFANKLFSFLTLEMMMTFLKYLIGFCILTSVCLQRQIFTYPSLIFQQLEKASVTLDPNTAAPWLSLSEDLTIMGYSPIKQQLPDNPERFDSCVSVLGSEGFTSGRHHWDVDVMGQSSWCLGVARESIRRKGIIKVDPENGFWAIGLMDGNEYYACTSPWRTDLSISPKIIRVYLDYKGGKVSFYNLENMALLYTFTDTFTEKLYPYFCPYLVLDTNNLSLMKIYPQKVILQD
ncbi:zinc-binding protein A33-like [Heterodontus francisci]|uniref:zinc-binding protein A33-like n=1 Tax=Heterodontus francisci TaxID=7792 RepID=UPI00355BC98B